MNLLNIDLGSSDNRFPIKRPIHLMILRGAEKIPYVSEEEYLEIESQRLQIKTIVPCESGYSYITKAISYEDADKLFNSIEWSDNIFLK